MSLKRFKYSHKFNVCDSHKALILALNSLIFSAVSLLTSDLSRKLELLSNRQLNRGNNEEF